MMKMNNDITIQIDSKEKTKKEFEQEFKIKTYFRKEKLNDNSSRHKTTST